MRTDGWVSKAKNPDALYNLDQGRCAKPCEDGDENGIPIDSYMCYHENWWKKFDTKGGKYCRRNYFVAGLFRSHCNSLYCIEMAKCCMVKKSIWTDCKWVSQESNWIKRESGLNTAGEKGFIVGFWRNEKHTLQGITKVRVCTPIWWGPQDKKAKR